MSNSTSLKQASGARSEPGRSAARGRTGTKRSADAALIEVSLKGAAADRAAPRDHRKKGAAALESGHPPCEQWGDADIAATAADRLAWHEVDPGYRVILRVDKGWITLSGHVDWLFQKDAVEQDVRRLLGVTGVTNTIEVQEVVAASGRSDAISSALHADADRMPAEVAR